ncbi:hypothetical protein E4S40_12105 [Algoriphagus kandeliae]|uniref:Uncharacterized protein n=1 Tax=Algoriphagus kandeliae TaxID=2562278 RepID=A0A4Y9QUQ6_9BACT|nr:hypothetical protein [Algoriphagus kandeliae]TFV94745.1 hypothetical protein E4S40_12105 [Algoriphagus kandeliae]
MAIPELVGKYNDPVFHQIKNAFNQRSDDFPILMLPVRLETKFMKYSRLVKPSVPGKGDANTIIQLVYKLIYEVQILEDAIIEFQPSEDEEKEKKATVIFARKEKQAKNQLKKNFADFQKETERITGLVNKIKEAERADKLVLRHAAGDLKSVIQPFWIWDELAPTKASLMDRVEELVKAVERLKTPSRFVYEKGKLYLDALEKLNKSIDGIFVSNKINAATLDKELKNIEDRLSEMDALADAPDFRATEDMIKKIQSNISLIKRKHKSGNVRLTNFKIGYTGKKDLKREEYELRKKINSLKEKIDQETVPVVRFRETLKTFPIKQLNPKIVKASFFIAAKVKIGIKDYRTLISVQKELITQLKDIHKHAQLPLDGSLDEINKLKKNYGVLKKQLLSFQAASRKIRTKTPLEKRGIAKLNTQLSGYLKDMQELEPGFKKLENQILAENKIKISSLSSLATRRSIVNARDVIVANREKPPKQALEDLKSQLSQLQEKIKTTASSTILLPRGEYNQLKSAYFSLRDQVNNVLKANPLPEAEGARAEADRMLVSIENQILDQLVDINDPRDRFYEDYRNRVIFTPRTEEVNELWVRIFPDDIAIDNHDERLTDNEEQAAKDFYYEVYSKPESERESAKLGAWRAVAVSLGVRRAAYAIRALEPKEIVTGKIEKIKDELKDYLIEELGYVKNKSRLQPKSDSKLKKLEEAFASAPLRIKKLLASSHFTPCLETKGTLDIAISYFRQLIESLESWITSRTSALQKSQIEQLALQINELGKIIYEYYKDHLKELNEPFKPALTFPNVPKKTKSWDRAGFTEVLPDRFVVITKRGDQYQHIATGKTIQKPLPVSLDPSGDQADYFKHLPNGDLEVPGEINWMFDFNAAVEAGMAVKIPLDKDDWDKGFDLVMVYGVQNKDANQSQELLNKLFINHLYSEGGLEYLAAGTATNNTDQVKSPYRALDDDLDGAFDLFFASNPPKYVDSFDDKDELEVPDGQFFKEALGLPESLANYIRNHDKKDICLGRAMNRALFNATLKYYFKVMIPNLMQDFDINQTMLFMLHHVSALGTLPIFRVDNQPYGIVPVSPVELFKSQGSTAKGTEANYIKNLTLFLKQTKKGFENFRDKPLHINSDQYKANPQAEFLKVLGLEPFSKEFFYRFGVNAANRWQDPDEEGEGFQVNWDYLEGAFTPGEVAYNYKQLLSGLGHTTTNTQTNAISKSNIYKNRFTEGNFILGPLVQDEQLGQGPLAVTDKGKNYLEWILDQNTLEKVTSLHFEDLPKVEIDGEEKTQYSVLMAMIRGAWVYDHGTYARKALEKIKNLDVSTLERLLSSHIDLVTYRLDAWLTGLSDYRLRELRSENPSGTYLGAYGFVHDLRRSEEMESVPKLPKGLESSNGQDVKKLPDSQGFIHGPSMNHAVTAAVLRAGYNSIKAKGDSNNALSVNLTSARVRKALHLLEGVGNGQETGALLGYQFERALHEKYEDGSGNPLEMDVYIYRLRRKFPTYSDSSVDPTDTTQSESIKALNVVDGLALIDHVEKHLTDAGLWNPDLTFVDNIINDSVSPVQFKGFPWGLASQLPNPAAPSTGSTAELERKKIRAIVHELDNIADAIDALGDLVTAEGVYQLVRGNHVRASAVLNAISEGKVPLDPEIIKTFRQGVMVTQRALLQIPVIQNSSSPWVGVEASPRSKAEPSLNHWLASKIGDPELVAWKASFGDTSTSISLSDLGMQPIDLVPLVTSGGDDSLGELQARCIDYLRQNGATSEDDISIQFNEASSSSTLSFGEIVSMLQHLGKVIGSARAADARDYRIAEDDLNFGPEAAGVDLTDLNTRITTAISDYQNLLDSLSPFEASKTSYSSSENDLAIDSLKALSNFGFSGFYPVDPAEDVLSLAQRILSAKVKMAENITFAQAQLSELEFEIDQGKWISFASEFSTKFFGSGFKIVPKITLSNESDLSGQLSMHRSESPLRHQNEAQLQDWWSGISLVRNRLGYLETVSILGEVLHDDQISFQPVQLPFDLNNLPPIAERDYWLGAEFPDSYIPDGDRLSLLIFGKENLQANCCSLFLDEWMEIIPDPKETTGIAFHFNQPDSRAPQSLLLAVPPEKRGTWDFEELALCVEEAFQLAKLRAVEPDQVDKSMFSQVLPATATLAFGDDEFARKLAASDEDETNDGSSGGDALGYFIDYTSVNVGYESEE